MDIDGFISYMISIFWVYIYIIYNDDIITLVLGVVTPYFIPFRAVSWATTGEGQEFQVRHFSQRGFTQ